MSSYMRLNIGVWVASVSEGTGNAPKHEAAAGGEGDQIGPARGRGRVIARCVHEHEARA